MPAAEIVTIGTEILLGEIVDTNAGHIARVLRSAGVDVFRVTTVGDNPARIAAAIREAAGRADLVITTGGLGPTVDDPTRDAVAAAAGVATEFRLGLWDAIRVVFARYGRPPSDNNRRQAYVPAGAVAIPNPVGTAPGFRVDVAGRPVVALPGVPREMEHLLAASVVPWLRERFAPDSVIVVRVLHTAGVGESHVDRLVHELEALANPTVGLAAHAGRVDVRITAKARDAEAAAALIAPIEADVRGRLGASVYGADDETLADAALGRLERLGWRVVAIEAGLEGRLSKLLASSPLAERRLARGEVYPAAWDGSALPGALEDRVAAARADAEADVGLGAALVPGAEVRTAHVVVATPAGTERHAYPHGGHPRLAAQRAANLALDALRRVQVTGAAGATGATGAAGRD